MKVLKFLILVLSTSLYTGCLQKDCCDSPAPFPLLKVQSTSGSDLLDPETENSFAHDDISLWTFHENRETDISIDISPNLESDYRIRATGNFLLEYLFSPGSKDYYLELSPDVMDTITMVINANIRREEVLLNGKILRETDDHYYIIVK